MQKVAGRLALVDRFRTRSYAVLSFEAQAKCDWIARASLIDCRCLEKRSQALRGRNLTRDIQVSGVPMVHLAPGDSCCRGPFCCCETCHWTSEPCLKKSTARHRDCIATASRLHRDAAADHVVASTWNNRRESNSSSCVPMRCNASASLRSTPVNARLAGDPSMLLVLAFCDSYHCLTPGCFEAESQRAKQVISTLRFCARLDTRIKTGGPMITIITGRDDD